MYGSAAPSFHVIVSDPFSPCLFDEYEYKCEYNYRIRSKSENQSDEAGRLVYVPAVNIKGDPLASVLVVPVGLAHNGPCFPGNESD